MTNEQFNAIVKKQLAECIDIMTLKGKDYPMEQSDRLSNFKHSARRSGTTPLQAWLVFFLKHEECIEKYVRGQYADSEPIHTRIADCINYLLLFCALIDEDRLDMQANSEIHAAPKKPTIFGSLFHRGDVLGSELS